MIVIDFSGFSFKSLKISRCAGVGEGVNNLDCDNSASVALMAVEVSSVSSGGRSNKCDHVSDGGWCSGWVSLTPASPSRPWK